MIDPRAIALQGIGYAALAVAVMGFAGVEQQEAQGVGPDGAPRIVRAAPKSDTFIPADALLLQALDEDEILMAVIAQVVTSGGLSTWRRS